MRSMVVSSIERSPDSTQKTIILLLFILCRDYKMKTPLKSSRNWFESQKFSTQDSRLCDNRILRFRNVSFLIIPGISETCVESL